MGAIPVKAMALMAALVISAEAETRLHQDLFMMPTAFIDSGRPFSLNVLDFVIPRVGVSLGGWTQAKIGAVIMPASWIFYSLELKQKLHATPGKSFATSLYGNLYATPDEKFEVRLRSKNLLLASWNAPWGFGLHGGLGVQWGRYRDPQYDHYLDKWVWSAAPAYFAAVVLPLDGSLDFITEFYNDGKDYRSGLGYEAGFIGIGLKYHDSWWGVDFFVVPVLANEQSFAIIPGLNFEGRF